MDYSRRESLRINFESKFLIYICWKIHWSSSIDFECLQTKRFSTFGVEIPNLTEEHGRSKLLRLQRGGLWKEFHVRTPASFGVLRTSESEVSISIWNFQTDQISDLSSPPVRGALVIGALRSGSFNNLDPWKIFEFWIWKNSKFKIQI